MPWRLPPLRAIAIFALLPASLSAQPVTYRPEVRHGEDPALINRLQAEAGSLYAGAEAGLFPGDHYRLTYRFALGVRPSLGRTEVDLHLDYQLPGPGDPADPRGDVTLDLARAFGARVRVETLFRLDPDASVVQLESDLIVRVTERFALYGADRRDIALDGAEDGIPAYRIGATRDLGSDSALRVDYGGGREERLGVSYQLRF